ncbi:hypothetical protein DFH08DRAFT_810378 [Mycena albidolilacea]|uniref:Uncharacterized protein n=1 Tax=Mycena albidolilacea TaxID=1033008 RepID=A0AAD6ZXY7_9AGAR|nr:hypothetical protein DFH08DRAFT_810378 [Mycena albidolilacea]
MYFVPSVVQFLPLSASMRSSKLHSRYSDNISPHDEDSTDTLLDSAISLRMSDKAPKRSWFTTSTALRLSSLILHSALVVIHLALVVIWARGLEHRFTVALENEKVASFLITATSTAFGTIFSAILVFVTQALSRRQSLQMDQVLTATHDNAAAWGGIGAALLHLWYQKAVCASIGRTLTATLYLMAISALHITISSLFSLVTFNSSRSFLAATRGLPAFNGTVTVGSDPFFKMYSYALGSLYFLPSVVDGTTSLGLQDGSLYDVLDINVPSGHATVNASGFNITCGSVPEEDRSTFVYYGGSWQNSNHSNQSTIYSTRKAIHLDQNIIPDLYLEVGMIAPTGSNLDSIVLYSTIPIVDSSGKSESWVDLSPPMNTSVSLVQLLQCSLTLWGYWYNFCMAGSDVYLDNSIRSESIKATVADVDTQNVTLHDLENALSTLVASMFWTCHSPPKHRSWDQSNKIYGNGTIDAPLSDIPTPPILLPGNGKVTEIFAEALVELNIIDRLRHSRMRLSKPPAGLCSFAPELRHDCYITFSGPPERKRKSRMSRVCAQKKPHAALRNLSNSDQAHGFQVSAGLAASMILTILASACLLSERGQNEDDDLPLNGTGILHAVWLYRNHPELETLLEQVEHPTDENLRAARA